MEPLWASPDGWCPKKLVHPVRHAARRDHCSPDTAQTCASWITCYILFHHKRHPAGVAAADCLDAPLAPSTALRAGLIGLLAGLPLAAFILWSDDPNVRPRPAVACSSSEVFPPVCPFWASNCVRRATNSHILPEAEGSLLTAIPVRVEMGIAQAVAGAFSTTSTMEVIAISGFNLSQGG